MKSPVNERAFALFSRKILTWNDQTFKWPWDWLFPFD